MNVSEKSFPYLILKNLCPYIWVVVLYLWVLILWNKWLQVTSYPTPMNKKLECKDHQIYIMKYWERSVKGKSNLSFVRVINLHPLINIFYSYICYGLKLRWWSFLVLHSERLLISSASLLCRHGISTFSMLGRILAIYNIIQYII